MPASFGIVHPLWDYAADEGALLERVAGAVGLEHVTVPVVTGPRTRFRLSPTVESPLFQTEGGWHYRLSTKSYATVGLKPKKARWFAGGDLLAQLRTRCSDLHLKLGLRLDLRMVHALVDEDRHLCQRNAWGQEVPFAGGCVSNPALRELLHATLGDLQRYEPASIQIVDWLPDCASDRATARPLDWHATVRTLLDVCFCASCRQIAQRDSVDADQAARSARVWVERLLGDAAAAQPFDEDPILRAYVDVRRADVALWLQRLAADGADRSRWLVRKFGEPVLGNCPPWVRLLRLPTEARGPLDAPGWQPLRTALGEISGLATPVWRPTFVSAADLVRFVSQAADAGVSMFDFEGLGEAPEEAITWLKQAVRKARRDG